jgi:hypothetical protein
VATHWVGPLKFFSEYPDSCAAIPVTSQSDHPARKDRFLEAQVLRISPAGHLYPSRLARIYRDSLMSSLAVRGDVMNHRSNLVAGPVVSERRNHHLHQVSIQPISN